MGDGPIDEDPEDAMKKLIDEDGKNDDKYSNFDVDQIFQRTSKISQPTKSDLYGDEELASLMSLHQQLQSSMEQPQPSPAPPETTIEEPGDLLAGGLHELILETVETIDKKADTTESKEPSPLAASESASASLHELILETVEQIEEEANKPPPPEWIPDSVRQRLAGLRIVAVASDVDGTIIGADQTVHPRTIQSILAAQKEDSGMDWVFPATGKTRWGARNSLGPELASLTEGPGVYNQGLYCLGTNGEVIFEKKLGSSAIEAAEQLVADAGIAVSAYDGDDLYSTDPTRIEVVELHEKWGEPASRAVRSLSEHAPSFHKLLLMDDDVDKLKNEVRPKLERLAEETGSVVTQAIPTMLELLPAGCSKAVGVQKVCEHLGIDPGTQLLALGDAENDIGMLEMSAIGVAVGNAGSDAKDVADIVLPITSSEGGVGLALNDILGI